MRATTLAVLVDGMIALALIAAATVLLALHDISETTAVLIYGVAVTLIGGSAKALLALRVPAPVQAVTPPPPPVAQP